MVATQFQRACAMFRRKLSIPDSFKDQINDATADMTLDPDWGLFMTISDTVAKYGREDHEK